MRKRRNKTKFRALLKYLPSHAFWNSRSQLMESYMHRTTVFLSSDKLGKKDKQVSLSWKRIRLLMKSGISPSGRVYNSWCDPHASQCLISLSEYGNNLTHDTKLLPSGWRLCMVSKKVSWLFKIAENERWILCNTHHTQSLIFLSVSLPIPLPQMKLILRLEIKRKTSRTCNMGDNTDLFREQTLPWQPVVSGATVWCSRKETPRTWPSGSNSYSLCSCGYCKEAWCLHEGETRHHQLQWTQVASLMSRQQGRGQVHGKKARYPAGPCESPQWPRHHTAPSESPP